MSRFEKKSHSFVIRLWQEPGREKTGATAVWRGRITHVQSREHHYFRKISEISHVVAAYLANDDAWAAANVPTQETQ